MKKDDFLAAHGLDKPYDPATTEDKLYTAWNDAGYFNPDTLIEKGLTDKSAPSFSMVLPPPNVTGILHIGHAAMLAIEDIVIRYNRMKGNRTLWLPGTDHAAIATQSKVEKDMQKEGVRRSDLTREQFMERIVAYASASHDTIVSQIKKMGSSVDWSREAYTLDEPREKAVRTAFKRMYDAGLIYRGGRIINWDPKGQTTISDDELVYKEETTKFYYLKYGPFTIGTARPETKFGDKYIVVHPDDPRYAQYEHGQTFELEWINGPMTATVIKDKVIDMEFGTGAMTITPWHSVEDFEIAKRHNLQQEQIIDLYGKLLPIAGEFAGKKIAEARPLIVEKLAAKGLLEKTDEKYTHRIATAERTGAIVEPQIMTQWFIDVNKQFPTNDGQKKILGTDAAQTTLKELMIASVRNGHIKIVPERFEKIYFNWVDNLRDWCISRQIIFGHQIPVWYKHKNTPQEEMVVGMAPEGPKMAQDGSNSGWEQDTDTLDTWFSSGLWTFSTLGWPDAAAIAKKGELGPENDFANFHPTNLLETGYDIIFFWVARMVLMSTYLLGEIPFKTVYLHGLVRDAKGQKMSKSDGNTLDPIEMIQKFSTDAVRLSLIIGTGPGSDSRLSEDKIRGYRNFGNKLWNISRFILGAAIEADESVRNGAHTLLAADQALVAECTDVIKSATTDIEQYMLHLAGEKLYAYAWHRLADIILEESKAVLNGTDDAARLSRLTALCIILKNLTLALHPFIPFVTEAIYTTLAAAKVCDNHNRPHAIVAKWPVHG